MPSTTTFTPRAPSHGRVRSASAPSTTSIAYMVSSHGSDHSAPFTASPAGSPWKTPGSDHTTPHGHVVLLNTAYAHVSGDVK
jgi:hypothetical protein